MFIAPLAIFAYRFLYPEARLPACIFYYYMADNVLILQILFSRTLAMLLSTVIWTAGSGDDPVCLCSASLAVGGGAVSHLGPGECDVSCATFRTGWDCWRPLPLLIMVRCSWWMPGHPGSR